MRLEAAFKRPEGDAGDDGGGDAGSRPQADMASFLDNDLMDMSFSSDYRQRREMDSSVCSIY